MKLKGPLSGDFDPKSMVLKISGKNSRGKTLEVSMPVTDPSVFVGWISAVLFEKYNKPDLFGKGLIANAVSISAHRDDSGTNDITFAFKAGEMRLAFVVPVHTRAPERLASIKAHLDQALAEMMDPDIPTKQ